MLDQTSKVGCACVIANGQWEPCAAHDAELAALEATGGIQMERVPLADAGFSLIRMQGAHTRESGAWHVTDVHMTPTARGKAPDKASRAVTHTLGERIEWPSDAGRLDYIEGALVRLPEPKCPALLDVMLREAVAESRERIEAERASRLVARGNHAPDMATTTAGRKAQAAERKGKRRTAAQMAALHNSAHVARQDMDAERMLRLTSALAVGGDSWADRQG